MQVPTTTLHRLWLRRKMLLSEKARHWIQHCTAQHSSAIDSFAFRNVNLTSKLLKKRKWIPNCRGFTFWRRDESQKGDRDIFNEKPSREEQTVASTQERKQVLGTHAIIRTTKGDIHIRLLPDVAPKAVENFVTHSKNGYYDNLIFHRVIKGFMIQTGCPFGE